MASYFEIDDVIDPADSRRWITTMLTAAPARRRPRRQEAPQHRHLVRRRNVVSATVPAQAGVDTTASLEPRGMI